MTVSADPRPLLLGLGWPPDQEGGLNRYFRDLATALPDAAGVVIGPAAHAPGRVTVVSDHDAPLRARLRAFSRAVADAAAQVDVVDAHFALYAALPVRFGPASTRPLVVHFHGPWTEEVTAQRGSGRGRATLRTAIERFVYRRAALAVVLSGAFARVLIDDYGVSPWRIRIVPPGVDLVRFQRGDPKAAAAELGLPTDQPIVTSVRRLVPRTGVEVLLDAWAGIDDGRALLCIAGDGPDRDRLERQAASLGLRHVRFLGPVPDGSLPALYRASALTVVPSRSLEGFGLVVLESLAAGTPVVVSDAGGLPEALAALDPTSVVPAGDATALRRRIAAALDGTEALPNRERCRAHAERHNWAHIAARHRELYAEAGVSSPPRRRVLLVDHCARMSGGEIAMLRLVEALDDVDVHVVTFEDGPLLVALGAVGVTAEIMAMPHRTVSLSRDRVGLRLPWSAVVDSVRQVVRLTRRIRRLRPDVVHANSLKSCIIAGVAARLARVPFLWHARDVVDHPANARLTVRLVRTLARRLPTVVVANSAATLASLGLPPGSRPRRAVVPDPLPARFFTPATTSTTRSGPLVVGIVGRLAPWKGQHVFLEAFARAFPDGGARAHVVGDALFGEDDYRDRLHARAAELGIAHRVEFRGFRSDVAAELAQLDVLVHASIDAEPFGQVVVEGMAAGLAVVATDAGGPAETIVDGHDGVLVPPGDVDALATALRTLGADRARRRALGDAARASAARYAPERVVPLVMAVYDDLGQRR